MDIAQLPRHRFTVDEFHRMGEAGIISGEDRVELIEGEIIQMTPISSRHAGCVNRLTRLFSSKAGSRALLGVQNPVQIAGHTEPQPDVVLLRPRDDDYMNSHPGPADVLLLVEVAESSLEYDRDVKVPAYARAGIPEVWLVDLVHGNIEVSLQPTPGGFQKTFTLGAGEGLAPSLLPDISLQVGEIIS